MVGFGRLGTWFGVDHWDVRPDLITFAKGVNSGYVPLGGVLISEEIAASFATTPYPGGLTYSGHPLACAAAVESIRIFTDEDICGRAADLGEDVIRPRLEEMAATHPSVGEVRGLGCFFAIELVREPATREMLVPYDASGPEAAAMAEVMAACRARGVWPFAHFNRLHVAPPLVIGEDELRRGLDALDEALEVADAHAARLSGRLPVRVPVHGRRLRAQPLGPGGGPRPAVPRHRRWGRCRVGGCGGGHPVDDRAHERSPAADAADPDHRRRHVPPGRVDGRGTGAPQVVPQPAWTTPR